MTVKQFKQLKHRSPLSYKWKQERNSSSTESTVDIGAFTIAGMTLFCIVMGTLKYGMDMHGW